MKYLTTNLKPLFTTLSDKFRKKLQNKEYRDAYMDEQVRVWIARQIRVLREKNGWSQTKFARLCGKPQSVISRLEDPSYGKVTLQTLLTLRAAFDVALEVRFVDFETAIRNAKDVSQGALIVNSYDDRQFVSTTASGSQSDRVWFVVSDDQNLSAFIIGQDVIATTGPVPPSPVPRQNAYQSANVVH